MTARGIAARLAALASYRGIAADDVFLFYVASHGTVEHEDLASREYFLIPSNVGLASDEALHRDAISQGELKRLVAGIPATKKILLLDTCRPVRSAMRSRSRRAASASSR